MKILAIETSCDDTGVAILEVSKTGDFNILSNIVSSQIEVHKKYGGVYPMMAKREHQKNLVPTLKKALEEAGMLNQKSKIKNQNDPLRSRFSEASKLKIKILKEILSREKQLLEKLIPFLQKYKKLKFDLIAVTNGPGLEPCLWVGINFAKALSYFWNIPIVPVNHIESHILVNFLPKINKVSISNSNSNHGNVCAYAQTLPWFSRKIFPAVCSVVSGGHTQIILMKKIGKYKILGETRDDAAGECFDKCAKILGLGYPGGPVISKLASKLGRLDRGRASIKLPRPMIRTKDYDFSFSGLKTAVLYHHRKQTAKTQISKKYIQEMAAEIQQAIIDVLIKKTIKAAKDYKAKTIILGGGVSANEELKKQLAEKIHKELPNTQYLTPNTYLSTDNALMTAITGFFHQKEKLSPEDGPREIRTKANLRI